MNSGEYVLFQKEYKIWIKNTAGSGTGKYASSLIFFSFPCNLLYFGYWENFRQHGRYRWANHAFAQGLLRSPFLGLLFHCFCLEILNFILENFVSEVLWDYGACTWVGEIHTLCLPFLTTPFCIAFVVPQSMDFQWNCNTWDFKRLRVSTSATKGANFLFCYNKLPQINFLIVLKVRSLKYISWGQN